MIATSSRNMARTASKSMPNDSLAFYPATQQRVAAASKQSDSFAFYPSTVGATRIPKTKMNNASSSSNMVQNQNQSRSAATCNYSRAELDAMFAKSRVQPTPTSTNSIKTPAVDSFAFYPGNRSMTSPSNSTATNAKDASLAFYPSNGVVKQNQQAINSSSASARRFAAEEEGATTNDNNMSFLALSSFAMGVMVQTGRSFARA